MDAAPDASSVLPPPSGPCVPTAPTLVCRGRLVGACQVHRRPCHSSTSELCNCFRSVLPEKKSSPVSRAEARAWARGWGKGRRHSQPRQVGRGGFPRETHCLQLLSPRGNSSHRGGVVGCSWCLGQPGREWGCPLTTPPNCPCAGCCCSQTPQSRTGRSSRESRDSKGTRRHSDSFGFVII